MQKYLRTSYIRDFPRDDCARNMSEQTSNINQSLICAEILSLHVLRSIPLPRVITWPKPAIQWQTLDLLLTWARDMVTWYRDMVNRYLIFTAVNKSTWTSNIKDVPMVMVLLSYFSRNVAWCTDVRMDVGSYGQSHDNQNFWDWWVTKFSKVWGSDGAPLLHPSRIHGLNFSLQTKTQSQCSLARARWT